MDNEDSMDIEDEPIRIKEVSHQATRPARSADADPFDFGVGIRVRPIPLPFISSIYSHYIRPSNRQPA